MSRTRTGSAPRSDAGSPLQKFATVLISEIRKVLLVQWSYRFNAWFALLSEAFGFLGAVFLVGAGHPTQELITSSALGYIVTSYARQIVTALVEDLRSEASAGTLEQMHMSATPIDVLVLGNLSAVIIAATIRLVIIILGLRLFLNLHLPFRVESVVVLGITFVGLVGLAYLANGLLFILKQTKAIVNVVTILLSFVNGAYLTLDRLPAGYAFLARFLPTTQGIFVLRRVTLEGASLLDVVNDGSLTFLVIHSVVLLILGRSMFLWGENVARERGLLGQY